MRNAPPPSSFAVLAFLVVFGLGGCATAIPEADPADIPRLQERIAANPQNTDLQVQLGMAQYKAEDFEQSRATLEAAVEAGNESGAAYLYLGMANEALEEWEAARDAYNTYLEVGRSDPLKAELRNRLQLLGQRILQRQAQQALAQEAQLADADPTPRSVAIFPFGFNSDREDLEPLIYALSDMMITDFAVSNALTVLERAQIQTLLDEMALTEAGYADATTGARAGRLLQAEHVVQGVLTTLGEDELSVDTDVRNVSRNASAGTVTEEAQLQNLFDMEKQLVFRIIRDVLGVELTPAEEQAILDNRADNVLAFLAYGRGLRERDRGNYAAAAQQFQQAAELDPGFDAASQAASESENLQDAATTQTSDIQQTASATGEVGGGAVAPPASTGDQTSGTLSGAEQAVNPNPTSSTLDLGSTQQSQGTTQESTGEERDPVQESQGQESVTSTATAQIRIVIKRPGGGQ